jgi:hypothetical protein
MIKQGRDLLVYADGVVVAAAKSCSLSMEADTLETAGVDAGARSYMSGRKDWSVKVGNLVTSVQGHFAPIGAMLRLSMVICDELGNPTSDRLTGEAFVTGADVTGTVGHLMQGSFSFKGSGALERPRVRLRDNQGTPLNDSQGIHLYAIGQL